MKPSAAILQRPLRIGFVPLVDCAPIAIAYECGVFAKWGLQVELMREPGWATIRDKMAYGELEAAHAPAGIAFALNWGLGVLRKPCLTGYLLNSNGDAITFSNKLCEEGVRDPETFAHYLRSTRRDRPVTLGVPHNFSTHHFLLLQWLRPAGIVAGRDVRIMVLPPSLMATSLANGDIDGYCVGEPFNTLAVRNGTGTILAESANLFPLHPEKALIVSEDFDDRQHETHVQLIRALADAAATCETSEGRETATEILARPDYLDLEPSLIRSSLFTGERDLEGSVHSDNFHIFHHEEVNRPSSDKASWLVTQMRLAGLLDCMAGKLHPAPATIFREDIYEESLAPAEVPEAKIAQIKS